MPGRCWTPGHSLEMQLKRLKEWGGKVVEFLDNFEGSFEDDEVANEALSLQKEGLNLGLVRVFPPGEDG